MECTDKLYEVEKTEDGEFIREWLVSDKCHKRDDCEYGVEYYQGETTGENGPIVKFFHRVEK